MAELDFTNPLAVVVGFVGVMGSLLLLVIKFAMGAGIIGGFVGLLAFFAVMFEKR